MYSPVNQKNISVQNYIASLFLQPTRSPDDLLHPTAVWSISQQLYGLSHSSCPLYSPFQFSIAKPAEPK